MDGRLRYEVGVQKGHHYLLINKVKDGIESAGNFATTEAAKEYAQDHYERRILSALEPSPSPSVQEAARLLESELRLAEVLRKVQGDEAHRIMPNIWPILCRYVALSEGDSDNG